MDGLVVVQVGDVLFFIHTGFSVGQNYLPIEILASKNIVRAKLIKRKLHGTTN